MYEARSSCGYTTGKACNLPSELAGRNSSILSLVLPDQYHVAPGCALIRCDIGATVIMRRLWWPRLVLCSGRLSETRRRRETAIRQSARLWSPLPKVVLEFAAPNLSVVVALQSHGSLDSTRETSA
jgi:hypothetical protein